MSWIYCSVGHLQFDIHLVWTRQANLTTKGWASNTDLLHFMTHKYCPFLTIVSALLLPSGPSIYSPRPGVLELHLSIPNLDLDTVSSAYELSFHSDVDENIKTGLFIEKQRCRNTFMEAAQGMSDGFDFLNMDAAWAESYYAIECPSPSSGASEFTPLGEREVNGNMTRRSNLKPLSSQTGREWRLKNESRNSDKTLAHILMINMRA